MMVMVIVVLSLLLLPLTVQGCCCILSLARDVLRNRSTEWDITLVYTCFGFKKKKKAGQIQDNNVSSQQDDCESSGLHVEMHACLCRLWVIATCWHLHTPCIHHPKGSNARQHVLSLSRFHQQQCQPDEVFIHTDVDRHQYLSRCWCLNGSLAVLSPFVRQSGSKLIINRREKLYRERAQTLKWKIFKISSYYFWRRQKLVWPLYSLVCCMLLPCSVCKGFVLFSPEYHGLSCRPLSVVYEKSFTLLIMTLHLHHTIDISVSYIKVSDCHLNNVHYVECSDM